MTVNPNSKEFLPIAAEDVIHLGSHAARRVALRHQYFLGSAASRLGLDPETMTENFANRDLSTYEDSQKPGRWQGILRLANWFWQESLSEHRQLLKQPPDSTCEDHLGAPRADIDFLLYLTQSLGSHFNHLYREQITSLLREKSTPSNPEPTPHLSIRVQMAATIDRLLDQNNSPSLCQQTPAGNRSCVAYQLNQLKVAFGPDGLLSDHQGHQRETGGSDEVTIVMATEPPIQPKSLLDDRQAEFIIAVRTDQTRNLEPLLVPLVKTARQLVENYTHNHPATLSLTTPRIYLAGAGDNIISPLQGEQNPHYLLIHPNNIWERDRQVRLPLVRKFLETGPLDPENFALATVMVHTAHELAHQIIPRLNPLFEEPVVSLLLAHLLFSENHLNELDNFPLALALFQAFSTEVLYDHGGQTEINNNSLIDAYAFAGWVALASLFDAGAIIDNNRLVFPQPKISMEQLSQAGAKIAHLCLNNRHSPSAIEKDVSALTQPLLHRHLSESLEFTKILNQP